MRGSVAKQLRKAAKHQAAGLPEKAYYDKVEKTSMQMNPVTKKLERIDSITTRLEPETKRAVYKLLKKIYVETMGTSTNTHVNKYLTTEEI